MAGSDEYEFDCSSEDEEDNWDDDPLRCIYCGSGLEDNRIMRGCCQWCRDEDPTPDKRRNRVIPDDHRIEVVYGRGGSRY